MTRPILEVHDLKKHFPVRRGVFRRTAGWVKAVDGVNFSVKAGETLGLVGESGCGKTTVGRTVLRLLEPTSGEIRFDDRDLLLLRGAELRTIRSELQIIFQDPYSSLNPRMTIEQIVAEGPKIHRRGDKSAIRKLVVETLERVGMPADSLGRYPHEFSGGQRQRIGIARALALRPKFIVCDEAVSALDVSIQAQIVNLLSDLQDERRIAYLFIAHDLAVVEHISDRGAVMYLGESVESAPTKKIFEAPQHPYTKALLEAVPVPDPTRERKRIVLAGDVPSPLDPPSGCRFHPRCPVAVEGKCDVEAPKWIETDGHGVACHVVEEAASSAESAE